MKFLAHDGDPCKRCGFDARRDSRHRWYTANKITKEWLILEIERGLSVLVQVDQHGKVYYYTKNPRPWRRWRRQTRRGFGIELLSVLQCGYIGSLDTVLTMREEL